MSITKIQFERAYKKLQAASTDYCIKLFLAIPEKKILVYLHPIGQEFWKIGKKFWELNNTPKE